MKLEINNKIYEYNKNIRDDNSLRESFNRLSEAVFDIEFRDWYEKGYWTDKYIPYCLVHNGKVVSNVSVNKIDIEYLNERYLFIQIGTVMTDEQYRNNGLVDYLIKRVMDDWGDLADNIYLYANDSVLKFYPKYGFEKNTEYFYYKDMVYEDYNLRKLDININKDRELFFNLYKKSNPYSKVKVVDNLGLVMFYCNSELKDNIYYIEEFDTVAVMEYVEDTMICYDIFGNGEVELERILSILSYRDTEIVKLGFMPINSESFKKDIIREDDSQLFTLNNKIFEDEIRLPLMSRA